MKAVTLLYHDVVPKGQLEASGFCNPGSGFYKLDEDEFAAHLRAIAEKVPQPPMTVKSARCSPANRLSRVADFR